MKQASCRFKDVTPRPGVSGWFATLPSICRSLTNEFMIQQSHEKTNVYRRHRLFVLKEIDFAKQCH